MPATAAYLRDVGVKTFAIGVGDANLDELQVCFVFKSMHNVHGGR